MIVKGGIIQPGRIGKRIKRKWNLRNTASGAGVIRFIRRPSNKYLLNIYNDNERGKNLDVTVIPSLFIGKTGNGNEIDVIYIIGSGAYQYKRPN